MLPAPYWLLFSVGLALGAYLLGKRVRPLETITLDLRALPSEFLLDAWFFVRLRTPVLPPDLTIRNMSDPEDGDFVLGLAYEDHADYIAAVDHLRRIKGKNRECAQMEISWVQARQLYPKDPPRIGDPVSDIPTGRQHSFLPKTVLPQGESQEKIRPLAGENRKNTSCML